MRVQGRLTEWNDSRGFGFVTQLSSESRVFVHITEFPSADRRPIPNDLLTYETSPDERGRLRAVHVLHLTPVRPSASKQPPEPSPSRRSRRLASPHLIPILAVALVAALAMIPAMSALDSHSPASSRQTAPGDSVIASAFENQESGIQVRGQGTVVRLLPDDINGDRHQRFIIELVSGQTLLVAHNIDLAPRMPSLAPGAAVAFSGVYEWNAEGGVVHWTHHDPSGQHEPGWLDFEGLRYQ